MLDYDGLMRTIEPLVLKIHALEDELATLKAAPPPTVDLEPLTAELRTSRAELAELKAARGGDDVALAVKFDAVRAELDALKVPGLDAPAWSAGVYRKGHIVQHFHGQYFEAVADTAAEPGDGVAWRRLGLHGFRYRGLYIEGVEYETGDLVGRDGSMMLQTAGALTWLALRGKDGKRGAAGQDGAPGAPGRAGEPGKRGADGANLVKLEAEAGVLFAVWSDGQRRPIALEAVDPKKKGGA